MQTASTAGVEQKLVISLGANHTQTPAVPRQASPGQNILAHKAIQRSCL